jgi:hypothetical protein
MKIIITETQYNFLSEQAMEGLGDRKAIMKECIGKLMEMGFRRSESNNTDSECYSLIFQGNFKNNEGVSTKQFTFGVCIEQRFGGSISVVPTGRQILPRIYDYGDKVDSDYVKNEINFIYSERSGAKAYKNSKHYVYNFPLANCTDDNIKIGALKFLRTIISKFKVEFPQYTEV